MGRSPGEGKGYPLQCSGLGNPVNCIVHAVAESDTTERFSLHFTSGSKPQGSLSSALPTSVPQGSITGIQGRPPGMDGSSELAVEARGEWGEWTRRRSPQEAEVEPVCVEGLLRAGAAVLAAVLGRLAPGSPCPRGARVRAVMRKSCWERRGVKVGAGWGWGKPGQGAIPGTRP